MKKFKNLSLVLLIFVLSACSNLSKQNVSDGPPQLPEINFGSDLTGFTTLKDQADQFMILDNSNFECALNQSQPSALATVPLHKTVTVTEFIRSINPSTKSPFVMLRFDALTQNYIEYGGNALSSQLSSIQHIESNKFSQTIIPANSVILLVSPNKFTYCDFGDITNFTHIPFKSGWIMASVPDGFFDADVENVYKISDSSQVIMTEETPLREGQYWLKVDIQDDRLFGDPILEQPANPVDPDNGGTTQDDNSEPGDNPDQGSGDNSENLTENIESDFDGDGVLDDADEFPLDATESVDTDGDGTGDNADTDDDGDGVLDDVDEFPLDADEAVDTDGDGTGDNADTDDDGDGFIDINDNCPNVANPDQANADNDELGDACDEDVDGDGVNVDEDNCPFVANVDQDDLDGDELGDACDEDVDGDGVNDDEDAFPLDANESVDTDGDGTGDNADTDDDGDGVLDDADEFPLDATESVDTDGDGTGDNADTDDDADGVNDDEDNCAFVANANQDDYDSDNVGDVCDVCPTTMTPLYDLENLKPEGFEGEFGIQNIVNTDGCLDEDGDGVMAYDIQMFADDDALEWDVCPFDQDNTCEIITQFKVVSLDDESSNELQMKITNSANNVDFDLDGLNNSQDNCPYIFNLDQVDADGDDIGDLCDLDDDNDNIHDDNGQVFNNLNFQKDEDGDGVSGQTDNCVFTANPDQSDNDGDGTGDACDNSDLDADGQLDNFKRVRLGYSPYLCYVKDVLSGEFLSFSYNFSRNMPVQVNDEFEVYGDFCNLGINKASFNNDPKIVIGFNALNTKHFADLRMFNGMQIDFLKNVNLSDNQSFDKANFFQRINSESDTYSLIGLRDFFSINDSYFDDMNLPNVNLDLSFASFTEGVNIEFNDTVLNSIVFPSKLPSILNLTGDFNSRPKVNYWDFSAVQKFNISTLEIANMVTKYYENRSYFVNLNLESINRNSFDFDAFLLNTRPIFSLSADDNVGNVLNFINLGDILSVTELVPVSNLFKNNTYACGTSNCSDAEQGCPVFSFEADDPSIVCEDPASFPDIYEFLERQRDGYDWFGEEPFNNADAGGDA